MKKTDFLQNSQSNATWMIMIWCDDDQSETTFNIIQWSFPSCKPCDVMWYPSPIIKPHIHIPYHRLIKLKITNNDKINYYSSHIVKIAKMWWFLIFSDISILLPAFASHVFLLLLVLLKLLIILWQPALLRATFFVVHCAL